MIVMTTRQWIDWAKANNYEVYIETEDGTYDEDANGNWIDRDELDLCEEQHAFDNRQIQKIEIYEQTKMLYITLQE